MREAVPAPYIRILKRDAGRPKKAFQPVSFLLLVCGTAGRHEAWAGWTASRAVPVAQVVGLVGSIRPGDQMI